MMSVLVPVEEGRDPSAALSHVIKLNLQEPIRAYLLNVRTPLPSYVARFIPAAERHAFHHENGMRALGGAIARLDEAGIAHREEIRVGNKAETILEVAREKRCAEIILDAKEGGMLAGLGLGSIRAQLRHLLQPGDSLRIREAA
ncbi:MAG TPA: universal stress protein [Burkholderiales bacterium]|nr:universal stress protein [Burkholderiales bacterium]